MIRMKRYPRWTSALAAMVLGCSTVVFGAVPASAAGSLVVASSSPPPRGYVGQEYPLWGPGVSGPDGQSAGPVTWTLGGTLPPGLKLDPYPYNVNVVGTPQSAGTWSFDITATDAAGDTGTGHFTLTVDQVDTRPVDQLANTVTGTLGGLGTSQLLYILTTCPLSVLNILSSRPTGC